uniref:Immunoglobulin V-set domain-containing protein n=1 Tax=Esox lucius TaxID=8010 RepID=A0AAY5KZW2_ESOLU
MLSVSLCVSVVAGVCVTSEVITRRGQEGGSTSIECPYDQGWETYTKYFYKGIWAHRVPVIQSNQPSNGRYSLYDDRERRVFTVIISTDLKRSDSGTYWCGVDRVGEGFHIAVLFKSEWSNLTAISPVLNNTTIQTHGRSCISDLITVTFP